ncbi:flagellar assembly protein FliH [Sphingomonas naasensis]|uniref:Flagellar biosynthesis protein FliH n=1 Tax=Sphingomonas naasensis TaxID=1344951 RepID=A0A4S1W6J1_9SPHN|nr:FliH/SctL family protein [Sphingomonas naasensis]NIJ21171.1 flagellar assembly protein FliH [Sphingomonas naasensis]TGX38248.1 flagellar biosynthesis protein FliH [Sphingomonas naasensis]
MSEFAPGFAGRIEAAAQMLHRAFGDGGAFAAADIASIGRRGFAEPAPAAPRHFSPADPNANPTEGWDPFVAEAPVNPTAFVDPLTAAHDAGFAEGRAAALAEVEEARARETALLEQVSQALAAGAHFDRERMAGHLRQTVLHLVQRMIGDAGVAPDILAGRIAAAVDLLADGAESALLRLHPDDVSLIQGKLPATIFPVGDPHVARGSFVIESASTIVEDGPEIWLEQLAQAIDRVPIPPAC